MKAKEYVQQFFTTEEPIRKQVSNMLIALNKEQLALIHLRGRKSVQAFNGCINEIANKYRAIGKLLETRYGKPIIKDNWVQVQCELEPEIARSMDNTRTKPVYFNPIEKHS